MGMPGQENVADWYKPQETEALFDRAERQYRASEGLCGRLWKS
jgi:hypothetical protein